ncbi:MAG: hypothetical protein HC857_01715 [Synechococcales cyanobacterium RU_4_20]|nr:hypothetical protein [Synechococcales cyanobacterium RU_4_20]NJR69977.1 hypothetical protein [Synechococcales cyanobacterium CRU_2_2]
MGDPAKLGEVAHRDRMGLQAVRQGLTAFVFAAVLGCVSLGLSACQPSELGETNRTEGAPLGVPARPAPVISRSPWVKLSQPGGFEQRYGEWLVGFEALNRLIAGVNQLPGLQAGVMLEVQSCDRPQIYWDQRELGQTAAQVDLLPADSHRQRKSQLSNIRLSNIRLSNIRTLKLCYELLSYLEDHFDGQSASPRERQIAVLDSAYVLLVRQLSQMIMADYGFAPTPEALDELTALLPRVLRQPSPSILLSGTQWIFNQGHPLAFVAGLAQASGQPLGLENYDRLICSAYGVAPALYPDLTEFPEPARLGDCEQWAIATDPVERWSKRLQAGSLPALPSGVMLPSEMASPSP